MIKKLCKIIFIIVVLVLIAYVLIEVIDIQKIIQEKIYPKKYETEVTKYAELYEVDKNLVFAIIKAESNFEPTANSNKGAAGLMQLMYDTAKDVAKIVKVDIDENSLLEPEININLGTKYVSMLINKYNNLELALAAYNAGSGNVDTWISNGTLKNDGSDIENIPYKETNNYVRKILRDYKIYQEIYVQN